MNRRNDAPYDFFLRGLRAPSAAGLDFVGTELMEFMSQPFKTGTTTRYDVVPDEDEDEDG